MATITTTAPKTTASISTTTTLTEYVFDKSQSDITFSNSGAYKVNVLVKSLETYSVELLPGQTKTINNQRIFSFKTNSDGNSTLKLICSPWEYEEDQESVSRDSVIAQLEKIPQYKIKKIVCFGDSITDYGMYTSQLALSFPQANLYNVGFAGCTLINNGSKFSMGEITDAIISADYSAQDATGLCANHLALLKTIDFTTVDIVTVEYGTNDFHLGYALGNDADTTATTIKGSVNYVTKKLLEVYPNLKIVFLTPTYRGMFTTAEDGLNSDDYPNTKSIYLKEYAEAIQVACSLNHIQCIDLYHNSGINRYTESLYLSDGLHPTAVGGEIIADAIVRGLTCLPYNTEMYFNKKDSDKRYQSLGFGNLVTDCELFENHLDENAVIDIDGTKYLTNKTTTVASYAVLARSKGIGLRVNTAILLTCKLKTSYTGNVRFDLNHYYVIPATISADVSATKVTIAATANVEQDIRLIIKTNATTDLTRVIETTLNVLNLSTGSVYIRNAVITKIEDYATTTAARPTNLAVGDMMYDTTLNKPIWLKTVPSTWVDAAGTVV